MLLRRFVNWLRPKMPVLNILLVLGAYAGNEFLSMQLFCQPVRWAALVLLASVGAFLVWPWLPARPRLLRYLALLLQGALLPIGIYCIWFLGPGALVVGLVLGFLLVPLLAWVPVVVAGQVVWRGLHSALPGSIVVFGLGVSGPLLAQGWAEWQFQQVEAAVAALPPSQRYELAALSRVLPRTYMAERLAGTLFKYHNYFDDFDGWRPPLHDPLVNVCLWLRAGQQYNKPGVRQANPLLMGHQPIAPIWPANVLSEQVALYKQLFPQEPVKADCACSHNGDAQGYLYWRP